MARDSFSAIVAQAIADIATHGYDSEQRITLWVQRIVHAAHLSMASASSIEDILRRALSAKYNTLISPKSAPRYHKGIDRFTLARVAPAARAELDRRIVASAQLIRLNREEAISTTMRRFVGWATSIPAGGAQVEKRIETKAIKKALAQLPFVERRVAIDQGHKMVASINAVIAREAGAIAGRWRHSKQDLYDARPEHLARDGSVFLMPSSWAMDRGLVRGSLTTSIEEPGEFVYCLVGESRIPFSNSVEKAYRRWYSGELLTLVTATNKTLRVTPNHPVLTPHGWTAANALNEGDDIIEIAHDHLAILEKDQHQRGIATIADIFGTLSESGRVESLDIVPASFHGDGSNGQVDVVSAARRLVIGRQSFGYQPCKQFALAMANLAASAVRHFRQTLLAVLGAALRAVRIGRDSLPALLADLFHSDRSCMGHSARLNTSGEQPRNNSSPAYADAIRNRQHAFARFESGDFCRGIEKQEGFATHGLVNLGLLESGDDGGDGHGQPGGNLVNVFPFSTQPTKLVHIKRDLWAGHVYNLQTESGWYVAEGIITHNCRCWYEYLYHLRQLPPDMLTSSGRDIVMQTKALSA